jgi:mono/diheme cytochrome c family protein
MQSHNRSPRHYSWIWLVCAWSLVLQGCGLRGCDGGAAPGGAAGPSKKEPATATSEQADGQAPDAKHPQKAQTPAAETPELGRTLYAQHCAACHGERGDGNGLAAAFLFPKPRDFRAGRFRLVSTDNNVPTREDLHAVLMRGMPGSSMPAWAHLSHSEHEALVDEVIRLRREGARDAYIKTLTEDEGLSDEEIAEADVQQEIQDYVDEVTAPGGGTQVPEFQPPTAEAVARGRDVYAKFACIQCHGETGRGDGVQEMVDDEKLPTRPRDFTLGIFKGNHDPASLYRRIAYGMPGSPMPGSSTMTPEQMADLVHYVLSLSSEEQRQAAIAKRQKIIAKRMDALPESAKDESWSQVPAIRLHVTPLWWRNDTDAELSVQAVHDGKTIAVRMTWKDNTDDQHTLRSEAFEDAVAVEFYRGPAEPFLGMGGPTSPVDVWFWDADRQNGPTADEKEYPNTVVDTFPFSEGVVASAELDRPGARLADQPDVSLPARASGNQIVPAADESGGSSLHVAGPRTVTFRPAQSQLVNANGTWQEGRWTVVMKRSLSVPSPESGVALEAGGRASVAFAIWNGSQRDRDGQKSFTIWHDLEIEK